MQISNLKTCINPSLNDVFPLLDIDGGISGKPILKKTTIQSIIDLLPNAPGGGGNSSNGFSVPTTIKTVAANTDYFIGIDVDGLLYQISKADLLAGLSSGGSSGGSSGSGSNGMDFQLSFVSAGDSNGVFYYIGTTENTLPWVSPTSKGLIVNASSIGSGSLGDLVNRNNSSFYTNSEVNSFVSFFLGGTRKLKCNYYCIETRADSSDYYPRSWKLQASNDGNTWIDLDTQVNNTILNSVNQWLALPVSSSVAYSYFRICTTGDNSAGYRHLVLGEVELYGAYTP